MAIGRIPEPGTGIPESIVDAKGDLVTATAADTPARLAVGTNEYRLVADSGETTGLKYVADTTNYAVAAKGDLLVGTAADTLSALSVGTDGYTLVADSSTSTGLKWAAAAGGDLTPYCSVNANSTTITDNVATEVIFANENFDSNNAYNTANGRFTPQTAGKYYVVVTLNLNANGIDIWHQGQTQIRKNGSEVAKTSADGYDNYANYEWPLTCATIVECNGTTDYISAFALLNIISGNGSAYNAGSRMVIFRIGA